MLLSIKSTDISVDQDKTKEVDQLHKDKKGRHMLMKEESSLEIDREEGSNN